MRVRTEHWQLLLNLCEHNPELITNKFNGIEGKAKGNALWQTVAAKLNSLGFGEKSIEGWRKALTDWKSKAKAKAAAIKREMQKTGGGSKEFVPLSALEERLLAIMGTRTIMGDENVSELGFGKVEICKGSEENEVTDEIVAESSTCSYSKEHDYDGQDSTSAVRPLEKRKNTSQSQKKNQRRRPNEATHLSRELLELNNTTVNFLSSINTNTESIANSLKLIANVIQNNYS